MTVFFFAMICKNIFLGQIFFFLKPLPSALELIPSIGSKRQAIGEGRQWGLTFNLALEQDHTGMKCWRPELDLDLMFVKSFIKIS